MTDNLVIYHLHSDNSLLDSCTGYKPYIDRAAELGQPAIAFSEHGKPLNWVKKKMYCDEKELNISTALRYTSLKALMKRSETTTIRCL